MTVDTAAVAGTRVEWAPVPRVNLLPPEILEHRRFVSVQRRLGLAVLATVAVCVGGYWWSVTGVSAAQEDLDRANATSQTLTAEKARYQEVPRLLAQVRTVNEARSAAMAQDILWYRVLNDLALATPSGVWVDSATFSLSGAAGAAGGSAAAGQQDVLAPTAVGSVVLSGRASGMPALAGWIESLDKVTPLDGAAVGSAEVVDEPPAVAPNMVTFGATAVLSPQALSHRYDVKPE
ncbi:MAG: hypothetical protein U0Q15_19015 [Kineosporiaceae bacterium]